MTTRREREERAEYDRLHAKYGKQRPAAAPADDDEEDDDEEDDGVFILAGRRADQFMESMFGTGKKTKRKAAEPDDAEPDDDEEDDDDEDLEEEPTPRTGPRFFRGRTVRG